MEFLPAAIDRLKKLGVDYADARWAEEKDESITMRQGKVESVSRSVFSVRSPLIAVHDWPRSVDLNTLLAPT